LVGFRDDLKQALYGLLFPKTGSGKARKTVGLESPSGYALKPPWLQKYGRKRPCPMAAKGLFIEAFLATQSSPYGPQKPCRIRIPDPVFREGN